MTDKQHDVLIIGAGVIGLCAAHYLLEAGRSVTIVDKGAVGSGASHGNAGYIAPSHSTPLASPSSLKEGLRGLLNPASPFYIKPRPDPALWEWLLRFAWAARASQTERNRPVLAALSRLSADLYDELMAAPELDCLYERGGLLEAYRDPERFAHGRDEAAHLQALGLPLRPLDRAATLALVPGLRDDIAGGVLMEADGHLDPAAFLASMARWLQARGAVILTDSAVTGFVRTGRTIEAALTAAGPLTANDFVLATGSWSPQLGRELDLRLPIQAAKGYSITVENPPGSPTLPILLMESRVALTPLGDRFRLAGTLEMAGIDLSLNATRLQALRDALPAYFRAWPETATLETWAGLRPVTPDGLPIIGRAPTSDNLLLAMGHAMLGISLAPATGKLTAQLLQGTIPDLDLTPFRLSRF
ncbi:MAG: FAD-dependent oxidoreductase [Anaerolineales bacterium]|nr:FAD-dependent oxidoreductase [Anaerolineales bacterium]